MIKELGKGEINSDIYTKNTNKKVLLIIMLLLCCVKKKIFVDVQAVSDQSVILLKRKQLMYPSNYLLYCEIFLLYIYMSLYVDDISKILNSFFTL